MQRSDMPTRQSTQDQHAPASGRTRAESRAPLLALGVVLLVFLVALGSSRSLDRVGGPSSLAGARLFAANLIVLVAAIAVIPASVFVIWHTRREMRGDGVLAANRRSDRQVIKLVLVIALIGGALAVAALGRPGHTSVQPPSGGAGSVPRNSDARPLLAQTLAPWVVGAFGACLVLLLVTALIQRRRRGHATLELPEDELESPRRELHEQLGISIAEIERESDPRRAVIRAYAGMESTLARHQLGRRSFEAPGEYLGRAFSALHVSRRPGERLTGLFEQARFSTHAIDPEMKREAIAALGELRSELEAKPR